MYVDDLVEAIWRLMSSSVTARSTSQSAGDDTARAGQAHHPLASSRSEIDSIRCPRTIQVRQPDITRARRRCLGWEPASDTDEGLRLTLTGSGASWTRERRRENHDR